jgi:hypothetical protein
MISAKYHRQSLAILVVIHMNHSSLNFRYAIFCTFAQLNMLVLSCQDVLKLGLGYVNINYCCKKPEAYHQLHFQQHYGSSPTDIAKMWYDIQTENLPEPDHTDCPQRYKQWLHLEEMEKSHWGC